MGQKSGQKFGIVDKDGKDIEVVLQPGDAIIYDAPYMEHWRPPFPGNDDDVYVQTFQHYVFLNGKFEGEIFDKKNNATSVEISNDLKSQIFLSKGVFTKKECKRLSKGQSRWMIGNHNKLWENMKVSGFVKDGLFQK